MLDQEMLRKLTRSAAAVAFAADILAPSTAVVATLAAEFLDVAEDSIAGTQCGLAIRHLIDDMRAVETMFIMLTRVSKEQSDDRIKHAEHAAYLVAGILSRTKPLGYYAKEALGLVDNLLTAAAVNDADKVQTVRMILDQPILMAKSSQPLFESVVQAYKKLVDEIIAPLTETSLEIPAAQVTFVESLSKLLSLVEDHPFLVPTFLTPTKTAVDVA